MADWPPSVTEGIPRSKPRQVVSDGREKAIGGLAPRRGFHTLSPGPVKGLCLVMRVYFIVVCDFVYM